MQDKCPVYHVIFPNHRIMAFTMLRFCEFYESPKFTGQVFDHEQYIHWYMREGRTFTYAKDWTAYNLPSVAMEPFYAGRFDPLWRTERALLELFRDVPRPFYIAGSTADCCRRLVGHEIVHGLYWLYPGYAAAVRERLVRHDMQAFHEYLELIGYRSHVYDDESNAYHLTGFSRKMGQHVLHQPDLTEELTEVYRSHFGPSPRSRRGLERLKERVHTIHFPSVDLSKA